MVLELSLVTEYTPEWNNNRKEAEPIVVKHKVPTMALTNRLIPKTSVTMKMDENGKMSGGESELVIDNTRLVRDMVTSIRGLTVKDGSKEYQIVTAGDLFSENAPPALAGLIDELGLYFQELLTKKEVEAKN